MQITLLQAFLVGVVYYMGFVGTPWLIGCLGSLSTIQKPLVAGVLVGFILGDPVQGCIIGAAVQMPFIAYIFAGGAQPNDHGLADAGSAADQEDADNADSADANKEDTDGDAASEEAGDDGSEDQEKVDEETSGAGDTDPESTEDPEEQDNEDENSDVFSTYGSNDFSGAITPEIVTISADEFKKGMSQVTVAASNDTTRPALRGVYFNTYEGALYLAATDGYRMAELKFIEKVKSEVKAIVPVESLQEVLRSISEEQEEVVMLFDETQVRFRLGEVEITSKLIDGTFPNYRELMPESNEVEMILDRAEVMRITKLAALFARAANGVIVAEANKETQKFSIAAVANEFGENNSEIECEIPENAKASMSARYVIDALNALEEEKVKLGLSTNKAKPILIENEKSKNYRHIIMPLNV